MEQTCASQAVDTQAGYQIILCHGTGRYDSPNDRVKRFCNLMGKNGNSMFQALA